MTVPWLKKAEEQIPTPNTPREVDWEAYNRRMLRLHKNEKYYLPEGYLPPSSVFRPGDQVLVSINEDSRNKNPQMMEWDGQWMEVERAHEHLDNHGRYGLVLLQPDGSTFTQGIFRWYHLAGHRPKEDWMPQPELPIKKNEK